MSDNTKKDTKTFEIVTKTLKFFYPRAYKKHKGYFIISVLNTIVCAVHPFISIMFMPLLIDELLGNRDVNTMILYTAAIVGIGSTLLIFRSVFSITLEKYDDKFQNHFQEEMSRHVMSLDFQLTEDKKALDQIAAAQEGMNWYSGGVHGIFSEFFYIIQNAIKILGSIVLIAIYAPILFVVTAILLIFTTIINNKSNKIEIENYKKMAKLNRVFGYLGWGLVDFRYGKDIRLYGAKDMMRQKWDAYNDESVGNWKNLADKQLPLNILGIFPGVSRDFASYFYLGYLVIKGTISIGTFSQMLSAGGTFHSSLQSLIYNIQNIIKKANYAYEYVKFMDYPAAIIKGSREVMGDNHTIEFKNVSFTYPNTDVKVLDNVSITLSAGEHLSVVGLNGAGKTTFIKLLCRLYDPTDGEILLDGINIKEYDYDQYMQIFSPVFQDFRLFSFSIKENIILDNKCADDEFDLLINQVGLKDKLSELEKGCETMIFKAFDENGVELSGGEQQKTAIARALFKKSPVVILDEPTAALDPVAEYEIYRQFDTLVGGKTAVYISHRLSSCRFCDRIAVFSEGTIKELDTHDNLVNRENGIYAEMFAAQAQYYKDIPEVESA